MTMIRLSLLSRLFPQCRLCGVKLQNTDPSVLGYFTRSEKVPLARTTRYDALEANLSDADRALLGASPPSKKEHKHDEECDPQCLRCRDVQFRLKMSEPLAPLAFDSMIELIDAHGRVVMVVSAQDFPLSFDRDIFKYRDPSQITIIVNKADLVCATNNLAQKYGATFFQDFFHSKYRVPRENVMVALGKLGWGMPRVAEVMEPDSYVVGAVNSGKLTIVSQLLMDRYQKEADAVPLTANQRRRLEKLEDQRLLMRALKKKAAKASMAATIGPGTLYMPGFTRGFIESDIAPGKLVYDVPGYEANEEGGLFGLLGAGELEEGRRAMKALARGAKMSDRGVYTSHYESVTKPGQVMSFGGLFALEFPGGIYQVRTCLGVNPVKFLNIEKMKKIAADPAEFDGMSSKFLLGPHVGTPSAKFERYLVPPFYGAIDIVLRCLGHVNITPTGKKLTNEPIKVWLPPQLGAVVRQPLTTYLSKLFTGRDAKGNPLRKENIKAKSTLALKRYANKTPFTAMLIPSEEPDKDLATIEKWAQVGSGRPDLKYDAETAMDESTKFDFWVEA